MKITRRLGKKNMFWSSPSRDLNFIIVALLAALAVSLIVYWKSKKTLLSIFVFSLLGNLILYDNVNLRFAISYNVMWLFKFTRSVWPYVNIILVVFLASNFIKNKYAKRRKI